MDTGTTQSAGQQAPESQVVPNKAPSLSSKNTSFPKSLGWVSDLDGILAADEIQKLSDKIEDFEQRTSYEIALFTGKSTNAQKTYHLWLSDLANDWGVGKKEKDNGVLVGIDLLNKEIGIATGLGIEEILTDQECKNIIDEVMVTSLKENDVYSAFDKALDKIMEELN